MVKMVREAMILNPEMNQQKQLIRELILEKYGFVFNGQPFNQEVWRNNFLLYQLEEMKKAEFVRIDNMKKRVDLSSVKGFNPIGKSRTFTPLLLTPNMHIELSGFTETYEQLMSFPNNPEFAAEFVKSTESLYDAVNYSYETRVNNMILQLLLINGYLQTEDLTSGRITEKVNRETLAAAKFAVVARLKK